MSQQSVLDYWFGSDVNSPTYKHNTKLWFFGGEAVDQQIRDKFEGLVNQAATGLLEDWKSSGEGCVALIVLLDQFPRNMYRGTAAMFGYDRLAIEVTRHAIGQGFDSKLPLAYRYFLYLPLQHSEILSEAAENTELSAQLLNVCPASQNTRFSRYQKVSQQHCDILAKFGRYPHRNEVLGRLSTPEEVAFLSTAKSAFMRSVKVAKPRPPPSLAPFQPKPAKLRIVVLHSFRQHAGLLRTRMKRIRRSLEPVADLVFANAPLPYEPSEEERKDLLKSFGKVFDSRHQRCWWNATADHSVYNGLATTRQYFDDLFRTQGPFDGVFGFSQGGAMAGLLAAWQPYGSVSFRFLINASGFPSRAAEHQSLYSADAFSLPSLHYVGARDVLVDPARTRRLASCFKDPVLIEHSGGHFVPSHWPVPPLLQFLSQFPPSAAAVAAAEAANAKAQAAAAAGATSTPAAATATATAAAAAPAPPLAGPALPTFAAKLGATMAAWAAAGGGAVAPCGLTAGGVAVAVSQEWADVASGRVADDDAIAAFVASALSPSEEGGEQKQQQQAPADSAPADSAPADSAPATPADSAPADSAAAAPADSAPAVAAAAPADSAAAVATAADLLLLAWTSRAVVSGDAKQGTDTPFFRVCAALSEARPAAVAAAVRYFPVHGGWHDLSQLAMLLHSRMQPQQQQQQQPQPQQPVAASQVVFDAIADAFASQLIADAKAVAANELSTAIAAAATEGAGNSGHKTRTALATTAAADADAATAADATPLPPPRYRFPLGDSGPSDCAFRAPRVRGGVDKRCRLAKCIAQRVNPLHQPQPQPQPQQQEGEEEKAVGSSGITGSKGIGGNRAADPLSYTKGVCYERYRVLCASLRRVLRPAMEPGFAQKQEQRKRNAALELAKEAGFPLWDKAALTAPVSDAVLNPVPEPVVPCTTEELSPLLDWLSLNSPVASQTAFARGTAVPDGRLDLCKQVVGPRGISPLLRAMGGNGQVDRLLLGNNVVGNGGAEAIAEFIASGQSLLTTWYIAGNGFDADGIAHICDALARDTQVTALWLKRNPLRPAGIAHVASLMRANSHIVTLDLLNTGMLDQGCLTLFAALQQHNRTLRHLYIGTNGITPVGATAIAAFLKGDPVEAATEAAAADTAADTAADAGAAADVSAADVSAADVSAADVEVKVTNADGDGDGSGDGNGGSRLHTLFLATNRIGDEGAIALASGLRHDTSLLRLGLASNRIGGDGVAALAAALRRHPRLQFLDLGFTRNTPAVGELGNRMGNAGARALAALLRGNAVLRALDITHNSVSQAGINAIRDALTDSGASSTADADADADAPSSPVSAAAAGSGSEGGGAVAPASLLQQGNRSLTSLNWKQFGKAYNSDSIDGLNAALQRNISLFPGSPRELEEITIPPHVAQIYSVYRTK